MAVVPETQSPALTEPGPVGRGSGLGSAGPRGRSSRGVSLVEAMVAVAILSIGLIGLAGLQITGLRFNKDAFLRSQASVLVYDVIEQMRMDRDNAIDNAAYTGTYGEATAAANCDTTASDANSAVACWRVSMRDRLPGSQLAIVGPSGTNNDVFSVTVTWSDAWKTSGPGADSRSIQTLGFRL